MKSVYIVLSVLCTWICMAIGAAQTTPRVEEMRSNTRNLEEAISADNELEQAESFYNLGKIHYDEKQWSRSETYLILARDLYQKAGNTEKLAQAARLLAQTQEQMQKKQEASANYALAAQHSTGSMRQINQNDVNRLSEVNLDSQIQLITQNAELSKEQGYSSQSVVSLSQLAEVQTRQENLPAAAENLQIAYERARASDARQAVEVNRQLVEVHKKNRDLDEALRVSQKILQEDFAKDDDKLQTEQKVQIAEIYLQKQEVDEAVKLLEESLTTAKNSGMTMQARNITLQLDSLYAKKGDLQKALEMHRMFVQDLPGLIDRDEAIVQEKVMEETSQVISGLLKEKELNQQILKQQRLAGLAMVAVILVMALLLFLIFKALRKLRKRNLRIRLQSLKREMNPHFIFNSLNSINQFIGTKDERSANRYLTQYSSLMRSMMENSTEDFISLATEIELLQNYLSLEKTRFDDQINYEILVDDSLDVNQTMIPGMILQPFVENAVWHGVRYLNKPGNISVKFIDNAQNYEVIIQDDGIGMAQSKALKTHHQKKHNPRGLDNVRERIEILNLLYGKNITYNTTDSPQGVTVKFTINKIAPT
ncbi:MAG: histidine kinase [Weeksellaceae bacterium]|nr:histidine kinase [Weeksellaceae bacterium]